MNYFSEEDLKKLNKPDPAAGKGENGRITIIGGSHLFHGAPLLSLKTAARVVDMVFFASPEPSIGEVASSLKSQLSAFIWIPWDKLPEYIEKSNAVLIGPGLMRYREQKVWQVGQSDKNLDEAGQKTKDITESLLKEFPNKQWVIDAGSLQTMDPATIPQNAILTPNKKEFERLFGVGINEENVQEMSKKYKCLIVGKNEETIIASPEEIRVVKGGNAGMVKGGTGDVLAGLTVALAAKNEPLLAACAASFIVKKAAEELYQKSGFAYSADDLAEEVPQVLGKYWR
ncbi:MAG: NAD(P)H-hydrate dehydratase [bacterium]|nr:NAD(P)H-hydrate dehydratase [bacterium]